MQQHTQTDTWYALNLVAVDAAFYLGEQEEDGHILLFNPQDGRWHCDCGPDAERPELECIHLQRLHCLLKTSW